MADERKTKAQLIAELKALHKSNAKLKAKSEKRKQQIDNLKRAQKRQSDTIMTYRQLMDVVPVGIVLSTPDGTILDVSETTVRLAGHKSKKSFIKSGPNTYWYDFKERDGLMDLLKKGSVEGYQMRMRKKDGTALWASINAVTIKSNNRTLVISSGTDITAEKQAEEALKESEEKFRSLADESPNMIFINNNGKVVYVNKKCEEIMGYTKEEFLATNFDFLTIIHPDYIEQIKKAYHEHLAGNEVPPYEYALLAKDGRRLETIISTKLINYEDGKAIMGIVTDITDRRKVEDQLRLLSTAVEQSTEGLAVSDLNGVLTYVNDAFAGAHGYTVDELSDKHLSIFHNEDQMPSVEKANRQLQNAGKFSGEIWHTRRDGTVFPTMMNNSLCLNDQGESIGMIATMHDITTTKFAEQALRASEERYRKLIETSPDAIMMTDLKGSVITANRQAVKQTGYDNLTDLLSSGRNAFDFLIPEDRERAAQNLKVTLKKGAVRNLEYTLLRKDGSTHPAEMNASLLTDADGNPAAFIAVTRDITERKKVEGALRESEEKYRRLIETSPDAITVIDFNRNFVTLNQQAARMLGFDNPEELHSHYSEAMNAIAPDDHKKAIQSYSELLEKGYTKNVEYNLVRKDGSIIPVEVCSSIVFDSGNNPVAIIGIARDITERKAAEVALRASEERYRRLIETSPDAILFANLNRKLVTINQQAASLFGYESMDDMLSSGKTVDQLVIPGDVEQGVQAGQILRNKGRIESVEFAFVRKDGSSFPGEVSLAMLFDDKGEPEAILGVARDITERKRIEEQLKQYSQELERLVEDRTQKLRELEKQRTESEKLAATGRMAARIAHEINNPLAGIKNSFRLIKDAVPDHHKYYNYVSRIDKEIDRIASIVQQMFYLYRPAQEKAQEFLLKDTIDDVVALLEPACRENGVSIKTKITEDVGIVAMPENLLRQVLYNILLNAIEASASEGTVSLKIDSAIDKIKLRISDRGKGVRTEDRSRIFEPFFSTKSHLAKPGLGLGLSISKTLVEAMQGEIGFTSTPGKGTTVNITLPLPSQIEEN